MIAFGLCLGIIAMYCFAHEFTAWKKGDKDD